MSVEVLSGLMEPLEGRRPGVSDRPMSTNVSLEPPGPKLNLGPSVGPPTVTPINVMGPRPERVYSHSLLLELKNHPLALQWPPYLDPVFKNNRGVWDPDRWHLDRKRGETPVLEEGRRERGRGGGGGPLDRDTDRIAAEVEDLQQLVLSPQRRSFLGGCAAMGGAEEGIASLRPEQPGKRVGSGRILARAAGGQQERQEEGGTGPPGYRRGEEGLRRPVDRRGEEGGRFGGFRGRERDEEVGWGDERRRDGGYYQHDERERRQVDRGGAGRGDKGPRRRNEPEWMNECVSKSDVIELRGFEERKEQQKTAAVSGPAVPIASLLPGLKAKVDTSHPPKVESSHPPSLPTAGISVEDLERDQREQEGNNNNKPDTEMEGRKNMVKNLAHTVNSKSVVGEKSFNYDQIMESMNLSSLLGGAPGLPDPQAHVKPASQSRFSQFFAKPSGHQGDQGSRRSSIQDELLGPNILKEINGAEGKVGGPTIKIPSPQEEERYFAPISPAAQTRNNPLLDMINKGQQQANHLHNAGPHQRGVQELEEGIRRSLGLGNQIPNLPPPMSHHQTQDLFKSVMQQGNNMRHHGKENVERQPDNLSAFKKLVAMVGNQPDVGREQAVPFGPGVVRPSPIPASLPQNAPTEQEILEHMMTSGSVPPPRPKQLPSLPPALAAYLAHHPVNTELLARPEAKQLILGLDSGNITMENILQQLNNPALQQRQRDLLLSVLKVKTMVPGRTTLPPPPPPRISPVPPPSDPTMLIPQPAPPTRVSPLMFPPGPTPAHLSVSPVPPTARVPSPQEMTVLTQHIMQQALIKRKLEEQKENYRRRQGEDGGLGSHQASGSPLAFTPTSVMRKTAAERKDSDPRPLGGNSQVPELKVTPQKEGSGPLSTSKDGSLPQPPPSPGRAITKNKEEGKPGQERPHTLELGGRRMSPNQGLPPPHMFPHHPAHPGHLLYLQNNNMGPVTHSMLSQANAMAQQQLAAANLLAHGLDPRLVQSGGRLPPPGGHMMPPGPLSPNRQRPPGPPPATQQGALSRFFSPEVLAQAQSGAVPAMPPLPTQKVLTLEEIERQAAAVVRI